MTKKSEKKAQLPKGWKIWRKIHTHPIGTFSLIASRKGHVGIFNFDGVEDIPVSFVEYLEYSLPKRK